MTPQEWNRYVDCVDCAQVVNSAIDPVFRIQGNQCLCLDCGVRLGGTYDSAGHAWSRPPNLASLKQQLEARS